MRALGIGLGEKKNEIGPLTLEQIKKLPLVLFIPTPTTPTVAVQSTPSGQITHEEEAAVVIEGEERGAPTADETRSVRLWRLFKYRTSFSNSTSALAPSDPSKGENSGDANGGYVKPPGKLTFYAVPEHLATCSICLLGSSLSTLYYLSLSLTYQVTLLIA